MPNGGFADTEEARVLTWYFNNTGTPPPLLYLALATAEPLDDGSNIAAIENDYGDYARQPIAAGEWDAPQGTDPTYVANTNPVAFAAALTTNPTATHWMLLDSLTSQLAAALKFSGRIVQPAGGIAIAIGTEVQFDAGAIRPQILGDSP